MVFKTTCFTFVMEDNMGVTNIRNEFVRKWIEFLWSIMGGLLFSMIGSIRTGRDTVYFDTGRWLDFNFYKRWDGFGLGDYLDEFVLGFIITFILVKSIKKYNSLK